MSFIKSSLILGGTALLIGTGTIYFGLINPGADKPHSAVVYSLIETVRDRAIAVRANDITIPALTDPAMIKQGAGNYAAMCTGCHLAPGIEKTEMSKILYPAPPNLSKLGAPDPARAFWVIKHGVKASGMAAWGTNMKDEYIWDIVAFLKQFPTMTSAQYEEMVAASGGHSHGGGEDSPREHSSMEGMDHGDDEKADHHDEDASDHEKQPDTSGESSMHRHSNGSLHDHAKTNNETDISAPKDHDENAPHEHKVA